MNIPVPKFISDIIDGFTARNVFGWLKQVMVFFVKPKSFFKSFYQQNISTQIDQLIFYIALFGCYYLLLFDNTELRDVYKNILNIVFLSMPFIVVNALALLLILRSAFNLWLIVSFCLLIWMLFSLPAFAFLKLFVEKENYTFFLLSNVCFVLLSIFQLLFLWHIVTQSFGKIFLGYIMNVLLFNIVFTLPAFLLIDAHSNDNNTSDDPIISEFNFHAKSISTFRGRPYSFEESTLLNTKTSKFSLVTEDSQFVYHESYIPVFRQMASGNVHYIDSVLPLIEFKRNQSALKELRQYFSLFNSYFDAPRCDTCIIEHQVYLKKGTNIRLGERKEYQIEYPYLEHLDMFNKIKEELESQSDRAQSPFDVFNVILYPSNLIMEKYGDTSVYFRFSL